MTVKARNRATVAGSVILVVALVVTLLPMIASSPADPPREIQVSVRNMAFYVDGIAGPNPVITLRPGEQVRLRLRSEDAGLRHDFSVKAWDVSTKTLEDRGQEDTIVFRAPYERGTATYLCSPHAAMMSGTIRIE